MSTSIGRWLKRLTTEDSEIEATKLSSEVTATAVPRMLATAARASG